MIKVTTLCDICGANFEEVEKETQNRGNCSINLKYEWSGRITMPGPPIDGDITFGNVCYNCYCDIKETIRCLKIKPKMVVDKDTGLKTLDKKEYTADDWRAR